MSFLTRTAMEQAGAVRSGEVSARELVSASLDAIARMNGALHAFVTVCPERALAAQLEASFGWVERRPKTVA